MLRHIRQARKECWITTVAILNDCPIEDIREYVKTVYSMSYPELSKIARQRHDWIHNVLQQDILEGFSKYNIPLTINLDNVQLFDSRYDLTGKGTIQILNERNMTGHIVSYEDGIVFDSCEESEMPFETWHKVTQACGFKIAEVTPIKEND